jgi:hypothetical protein
MRNPGVVAVWVTKSFKLRKVDPHSFLFKIGDPITIDWYAEGRLATHEEIMHSINTGLPLLEKMAAEEGGTQQLKRAINKAMELIP